MTKAIVDPDAAHLIGWYQQTLDTPDNVDILGAIIASGDIPRCAMQVRRDGLAGAIRSQAPDAPCTHYFEKAATGTTDGIACGEDGGTCIGAQQCRFGYCEEY